MTPGPTFWHRASRRPSFWLGLFVACFLAWAWWDSFRNASFGSVERDYRALQVVRAFGETVLLNRERMSWTGLSFVGERGPITELDWSGFKERTGKPALIVPDSLVFFSFVGVWVGWLAWRSRVEGAQLEKP
jgi:hypothetical protein